MKDKSKLTAIILAILAIIVLIINFIVNSNTKEENKDVLIVTNASSFYTVNSCLYRTITYISSEDYDSLLLLLPEKYKKENKITKENVLELFFDASETSTFISTKMYQQYITDDIIKYYVEGYIQENKIYDGDLLTKQDYENVYFIVYLDSDKNIFSIEPYNGKIFKEGLDEK